MYRIGIDVGSTYTKYCIMKDGEISALFNEKTPIRQQAYFKEKIKELCGLYPGAEIISCGYGKANVDGIRNINELTALAKGAYYHTKEDGAILDIGGQDTKIIIQEQGRLKGFFVNDKCAAGSGMFLSSVLDMIGVNFEDVDIARIMDIPINLSSTCAVFAQSEIVELIANNRTEEEILAAVMSQILTKTKPLLGKIREDEITISGGLSIINGIDVFASKILGVNCRVVGNGKYFASIGSAII